MSTAVITVASVADCKPANDANQWLKILLIRIKIVNIKYPVAAQKAKIQGRVVIQFIVDKEGNIICPRVIRGADPLLDAEAIRLTTIMPKWKPGMQRGQAVNVKYTVPIMFRLQEPEKSPAVQNATVTPTK